MQKTIHLIPFCVATCKFAKPVVTSTIVLLMTSNAPLSLIDSVAASSKVEATNILPGGSSNISLLSQLPPVTDESALILRNKSFKLLAIYTYLMQSTIAFSHAIHHYLFLFMYIFL